MKVCVTGANGYIGSHVIDWLVKNTNSDVIAVDFASTNINTSARFVNIDILGLCNDDKLYEMLGRPDVLIHLAWRDGFNHSSMAHMRDLPLHYDFITNMIKSGCNNITVMGTMHEVGYYNGQISDENPPATNPLSLYGVAKNALRQALFSGIKQPDVSMKWLRGFYITGNDTKSKSIFSKIITMEQNGQASFPFTDGKNKYDFVDVNVLAKMISCAAMHHAQNEIINICSGTAVSLKDKVEQFLRENNFKIKPEFGAFPSRPYDSPVVYGTNAKITKIMEEFDAKQR